MCDGLVSVSDAFLFILLFGTFRILSKSAIDISVGLLIDNHTSTVICFVYICASVGRCVGLLSLRRTTGF